MECIITYIINLHTKFLSGINSISWQLVLLISLFLFRENFKELISKVTNFKFGNFNVELNKLAEKQGVSNILIDLSDIGFEELKMFLIMGGEDGTFYKFSPTNYKTEKFKYIMGNLMKKDLIKIVDTRNIAGLSEDEKQVGIWS